MAGFNPYYYKQHETKADLGSGYLQDAGAAAASGGNPYVAAANVMIGRAARFGQGVKDAKAFATYKPEIDSLQVDAYGKPIYNLGDESAAIGEYDPEKAGKGLGMKGWQVGGPIGWAAGMLTRGKRRRQARKSHEAAVTRLQAQKDDFNKANMNFAKQEAVMASYNNDQNNTNLFGVPRGQFA